MRQIKSLFLIIALCGGLIFLGSCGSQKKTMRGKQPKGGKMPCPIKDC